MPHVTPEIWFVNGTAVNKKVDITDTIDSKLAAIKCHTSQFKNFSDIEKMMRSRGEGKGKNKKYFERFNAVKLGW